MTIKGLGNTHEFPQHVKHDTQLAPCFNFWHVLDQCFKVCLFYSNAIFEVLKHGACLCPKVLIFGYQFLTHFDLFLNLFNLIFYLLTVLFACWFCSFYFIS